MNVFQFGDELNLGFRPIALNDVPGDAREVARKSNAGHIRVLVQCLVDDAHRRHPVLDLFQSGDGILVLDELLLEVQDRIDDLQVVLHPVVNLLKQNFLLFECAANGPVYALPIGDVVSNGADFPLPFCVVNRVEEELKPPFSIFVGRFGQGPFKPLGPTVQGALETVFQIESIDLLTPLDDACHLL